MTVTAPAALTLTSIQREFPGWECWQGTSGRYYARRAGRPRRHKADVQADSLAGLRLEILRVREQTEQATGWTGDPATDQEGSRP